MKSVFFALLVFFLPVNLNGLTGKDTGFAGAGINAGLEPFIGMDTLTPSGLLSSALQYESTGDYQMAVYLNQEFLERTSDDPMREERGEVLQNQAFLYHMLGEFDRSLEYLMEALEFFDAKGDEHGKAKTYNNIANIYSNYGDLDLALEYYLNSLDYYLESNQEADAAIIFANIGYVKGQFEEYDEALEYLEKSIELAESRGDNTIGQLLNMGYIYTQTDDLEKSIRYYLQALEASQKTGSNWSTVRALNNLASIYIELQEYQKAESRLFEAKQVAEEHDLKELKQQNYGLLSTLFEETGRHAEALAYFRQYEQLKEELYSKEKLKLISEIQTLHEIDRKEQQIKLLKAEYEVINQEIAARKARHRLVLIGSGVFIFLLGLLYFQSRLKMKAYRQLVEKNLEILEKEKFENDLPREEEKPLSQKIYYEPVSGETAPEPSASGQEPENGERYGSSSLSDIQKQNLIRQVKNAFEAKKVFKDPDLSLNKLSDLLNTNNRYLSQIINESFNKSFVNLVNEYRIREARKLLADPQYNHFTIESVAQMVGYNSKSAFNRSFKKITGLTPSFFQKSSRNPKLLSEE